MACLGNHDLDFGIERAIELNSQTNFPWLLSNLHASDGSPLAGTKDTHVIEKHGLRFGFMGLAEIDWVTTLNCIDLDDVDYEDFISCGNKIAKRLREDEKCDLVIALTHLRSNNDQLLAQHCKGIDFILGGHDHVDFFDSDLPSAEVYRISVRKIWH